MKKNILNISFVIIMMVCMCLTTFVHATSGIKYDPVLDLQLIEMNVKKFEEHKTSLVELQYPNIILKPLSNEEKDALKAMNNDSKIVMSGSLKVYINRLNAVKASADEENYRKAYIKSINEKISALGFTPTKPDGGGTEGGGDPIPNVNAGEGFNPNYIANGDDVDALKPTINTLYHTIILVLQIASVAGVIIAGLRYMYASADTKADIKKTMVPLIIGLVLVFCVSTIIDLVVKIATEVGIK